MGAGDVAPERPDTRLVRVQKWLFASRRALTPRSQQLDGILKSEVKQA